MPKKLQRSVQECLSKNWILSGCKHPKTLSFAVHRTSNNNNNKNDNVHHEAATLSDIDRFLFENFKSLYINDHDNCEELKDCNNKNGHGSSSSGGGGDIGKDINNIFESPRLLDPPKKELYVSNRFFVGASSSSSLMEEARLSLTTNATTMTTSDEVAVGSSSISSSSSLSFFSANNIKMRSNDNNIINDNDIIIKDVTLLEDCIAVLTYSTSPYDDFRQSMQEMLEARMQRDGKVDWDFMEELLLCYLDVNEKVSHKFILNAFADIVVGLRGNSKARSRRNIYSPRSARENRRFRRRQGI